MSPAHTPHEYDLLKRQHGRQTPAPPAPERVLSNRVMTNEQIANYEMLRGRWDEKDKETFLRSQAGRTENTAKIERVAHTKRITDELRTGLAETMTLDELQRRAMGRHMWTEEQAKEFAKKQERVESYDPDQAKKDLTAEATKLLKFEERQDMQRAAELARRRGLGHENDRDI